jgi:hypothetical protein
MERKKGPLVPLGQVSAKTKLKRERERYRERGRVLGCHMLMMHELGVVKVY